MWEDGESPLLPIFPLQSAPAAPLTAQGRRTPPSWGTRAEPPREGAEVDSCPGTPLRGLTLGRPRSCAVQALACSTVSGHTWKHHISRTMVFKAKESTVGRSCPSLGVFPAQTLPLLGSISPLSASKGAWHRRCHFSSEAGKAPMSLPEPGPFTACQSLPVLSPCSISSHPQPFSPSSLHQPCSPAFTPE